MKKAFLLLFASLAFGGAIFAQHVSHWADFNTHDYPFNMPTVGFVQINGSFITASDNWDDLEIGAFVGDVCRGHAFMVDETEDGDPYPYFQVGIYYSTGNDEVSFKLYDHSTGIEYGDCIPSITILTGELHNELYFDYDEAVVLNFVSGQTFTKDISAYTESGGYYLIASPIGEMNPENVKNMLENRYDLYQFDQSQELEWRNYNQDGGFNLEPGKGYLYANSEDVTLIFKGTPYNGDGQVTLTKDNNASFAGWNLVGNPFAQKAYINKPFYTLNPEGTEVIAGTGNSVSAMEGLFVVAETDGETLTFSTEETAQPSRQIVVNVTQNRGVAIDRAIVRFGEGLMLPKFQISDDSPKIYIPMDGQAYAVVRSENIGKLPLNFNVEENGTYSIHVDAEDIELSYLHLIDNMTGADIDLLENSCYTFEAKTTDYASRFKLVFASHDSSTIGNTFAFIDANGNIIVNGAEAGTTMQIVDMTGRVIVSIDGRTASVPTAGMTAGVYVLRLINGNDMKTQKIVVR